MVSKKNNKITPKDINLLLNKLIIIIKKFSNSCGNKKKRVSRGVVGGFLGIGKSDKPKDLNDEIHDFLLNNFNKSQAFFKNISTDYFKRDFKNFFTKDKITFTEKDNFHDIKKNIQYNKKDLEVFQYITDNEAKIKIAILASPPNNIFIREIKKDTFIICFDDTPQLPDSKTKNIGYIIFANTDGNTFTKNYKICYDYYKLNKKLFDNFNKSAAYDISEEDIKIIKSYIKLIGDKNQNQNEEIDNYPIQDTLETFFYYIHYITKIDVDKNIIDINKLIKLQEKCGKTDKYILKHAVIYNIGIMLKSLQNILSN